MFLRLLGGATRVAWEAMSRKSADLLGLLRRMRSDAAAAIPPSGTSSSDESGASTDAADVPQSDAAVDTRRPRASTIGVSPRLLAIAVAFFALSLVAAYMLGAKQSGVSDPGREESAGALPE